MNIKVCGVTSMKQLLQLDGMNVDFAGLVFNKLSSQFLDGRITGEELIAADLDIRKVGIFSNASLNEIIDTAGIYGLDLVQLEGDEPAEFCWELSKNLQVIKTFYINRSEADSLEIMVNEFDEACDFYSFDSIVKKDFSGLADQFDWTKLANASIEKPFFLGGGIKPEDAEKLRSFRHPDFYGIDLNCYFEKEPGVKDMAALLGFIHQVKKHTGNPTS